MIVNLIIGELYRREKELINKEMKRIAIILYVIIYFFYLMLLALGIIGAIYFFGANLFTLFVVAGLIALALLPFIEF